MSVEKLARTIKIAVDIARNENGKAKQGIYQGGIVTADGASYTAVVAVPVTLYDGKRVWYQLTANNVAVIIGD